MTGEDAGISNPCRLPELISSEEHKSVGRMLKARLPSHILGIG